MKERRKQVSWRGVKCVFHFIQFNSNGIVTVSCTSESESEFTVKAEQKTTTAKRALAAASIAS